MACWITLVCPGRPGATVNTICAADHPRRSERRCHGGDDFAGGQNLGADDVPTAIRSDPIDLRELGAGQPGGIRAEQDPVRPATGGAAVPIGNRQRLAGRPSRPVLLLARFNTAALPPAVPISRVVSPGKHQLHSWSRSRSRPTPRRRRLHRPRAGSCRSYPDRCPVSREPPSPGGR